MPTIVDGSLGVTYPVTAGGTSAVQASSAKVIQVVNFTYSTTDSSSSSTYADTGISTSITPTSSSSKILVNISINGIRKFTADTVLLLRLLRGSTTLTQIEGMAGYNATTTNNGVGGVSCTYLDSPATTSSTTYKVQFASSANANGVRINEYVNTPGQSVSFITLMEIAA